MTFQRAPKNPIHPPSVPSGLNTYLPATGIEMRQCFAAWESQPGHLRLILLLDQGGSMVPFHALSAQLVEATHGRGEVLYFHDYADRYLWRDAARIDAVTVSGVAGGLRSAWVLIVSDAGAARGSLVAERVSATSEFLATLRGTGGHCLWFNPLPAQRWAGTTAGCIAAEIPMSALDHGGLVAGLLGLNATGWDGMAHG